MDETQTHAGGQLEQNGPKPEIQEKMRRAQVWAKETVGNTKTTIEKQIVRYPWQMAAAAALSGFVLSRLTVAAFERYEAPRRRSFDLEDLLVGAIRLFQTARHGLTRATGGASSGVHTARGKLGEQVGETLGKFRTSAQKGVDEARAYVSEQTAGEMAEDLSALVRRHPISSVLIGIGVGYLLSRGR